MADDLIRYDLLVQDALRGVVRKVLTDAAREGLAGEHHFYVSFRTEAPGVRMSQRLREKYPQDMTIVLQHQFWDLGVTEHTFEVGLSFSGVPERLLVPFDALTGFFDPSVQFGLKFDLSEGTETAAAEEDSEEAPAAAGKTPPRGAASEPTEIKPKGTGLATIGSAVPKIGAGTTPVPAAAQAAKGAGKEAGKSEDGTEAKPPAKKAEDGTETSAEVVSLDAFRKKS
ncbi:Stringent starvation protein B [Methylobacterium sp. Leaf465]|uniref:SspB family protein n=1 Tax=unclassified Methylobacterium TaxID=2615210 RepID=UPI0006F53D21|nr:MULTISPECIES: ClpXP protease specificity-enhancing factor SspB [unclassified Methylobacterium]KQT82617.1 Stringent starvation protein B [Methylobacterium sp. Leaf465]KQU34263.1 Stringent starvation protein B [Methylobacterium sp. Leaf94]